MIVGKKCATIARWCDIELETSLILGNADVGRIVEVVYCFPVRWSLMARRTCWNTKIRKCKAAGAGDANLPLRLGEGLEVDGYLQIP